MHIPQRLAAAARPFHRERVSRAYLWLVAAALLLLAVDSAFVSGQDASFSGIWLVVVTLPWTPLLWALLDAVGGPSYGLAGYGWGTFAVGVVTALASALVNALLLGAAARALRRHMRRPQP